MPDVRLKLTVAYDGTGFRGWARQPGERTVEGELRAALATVYARSTGSRSPVAPTPASTRSRTSSRSTSTGGPPPDAGRRGAEHRAAGRRRRRRGGAGAAGLPRALRRRSRSYRYRIWRRRERSPFELHRSLWHPRPLDLDRLERGGRAAARRARLPRVHADRHPARRLRPRRRERPLARPRRHRSSSRSPPTRSCATWCGRSSGRCSSASPPSWPSCCRARRARPRARPRRRAACT